MGEHLADFLAALAKPGVKSNMRHIRRGLLTTSPVMRALLVPSAALEFGKGVSDQH
jgi:hypothetical protein